MSTTWGKNRIRSARIHRAARALVIAAFGLAGLSAAAQQAQISSKALGVLSENASAARDALAGVNLEEEAANLLRFQQAFQAAAQIIKAADTVFQALIAAARG